MITKRIEWNSVVEDGNPGNCGKFYVIYESGEKDCIYYNSLLKVWGPFAGDVNDVERLNKLFTPKYWACTGEVIEREYVKVPIKTLRDFINECKVTREADELLNQIADYGEGKDIDENSSYVVHKMMGAIIAESIKEEQ